MNWELMRVLFCFAVPRWLEHRGPRDGEARQEGFQHWCLRCLGKGWKETEGHM